jgi:hypothetical protein
MTLSQTGYKTFWGTHLCNRELKDTHGRGIIANSLGMSPSLETSDGYLLLGRRNDRVAYYPSRVHPFAGCTEPPTDCAPLDLFKEIRRELTEELNLTLEDVPELRCAGLVEDVSIFQPEIMFRAKSRLTRAQIESALDRTEHQATYAIAATAAGVETALADPSLTPVAVASLLLWGHGTLGPDWFTRQSQKYIE